jgi:hypothetical protein
MRVGELDIKWHADRLGVKLLELAFPIWEET